MYNNTIIQSVEKIALRDELVTTKNRMLKENQDARIREESNVKLMKELDQTIPHQKNTIASMLEKEDRLKKEVVTIESHMEKSEMKLLEVKERIESLKQNLVNNQEAESIMATKDNVLKQVDEEEDILQAGRQKLQENSIAIEKMQALNSKMESLQLTFSFETSNLKDLKKNYDNLDVAVTNLKVDIARKNKEIEALLIGLQLKKENISKVKEQISKLQANCSAEERSKSMILRQHIQILRKLELQEDELLAKKQNIKDEIDILYNLSSNIIKQMSSSIYEY
jgi:chromosome segregation ATPase